jgi:hypothetical protein
MPGMILGNIASQCCFTWLLSLPPAPSYGMWPADDGTGPPVRRCLVSSLQWGDGAFPGDVKPPGLDIWWSIDHVDTCIAESYME